MLFYILLILLLITSVTVVILHIRYFRKKSSLKLIRTKVNHDLRSPLNAILGFSDLLLQTEKDTEKRKFLSAINSGGKTQLALLDDIATQLKNELRFSEKTSASIESVNNEFHKSDNLEESAEPIILIVDDMMENVVFLEKILQKSGFRTISALSGDSALNLLTEHTPDLILLDIVMPGMDGFETCARIQNNKDFIDIPVIFLSSKKDEKTIIESFIYGGIDYIIKPFNSPELLARVNTHIQLKKAKQQLHILAFTDALTGLFNRRKFIESLDQERARAFRYKENLSFIMIDIDHFKKINDSFGHDIGDKALIKFAQIVKSSLRETDFAGRLGGEEFGIILPQTDIEQAVVVADRIRTRIETESESKKEGIPAFTASFGLAQFNEDKNSSALLTQDADKALYAAKESGRNKLCRAEQVDEMAKYNIIVAVSDNLAIGKDNQIPWHVSEDLKLFKKLTTGNIIIMGRKTYESIGKPLPGRKTIVITSDPEKFMKNNSFENLSAKDSLDAALKSASDIAENPQTEVFVTGGASIYQLAIKDAERLYLSRIPGTFDADTFFPEINDRKWRLESTESFPDFKLEVYRKK